MDPACPAGGFTAGSVPCSHSETLLSERFYRMISPVREWFGDVNSTSSEVFLLMLALANKRAQFKYLECNQKIIWEAAE